MLVFNYVALAAQIIIVCKLKIIVRSNQDYGPLLLSGFIFLIIYNFFSISWVESPKEYLKKKKNGNKNEFSEVSFPPLTTRKIT
ncbi:hypothetical protein ACGH6R_10150 [Gilliamella sp. CG13]|uniref:hypothetical protein n=1 Tax=Gilliamella sp. CG13 TaxID=3351502 RepID=UPI003987EB24